MATSLPKLQFASRVRVRALDGRHVFTAHAAEAARLVHTGKARPVDGPKVRVIELVQSLSCQAKALCTPASIKQYMGQKYTYRERLIEGEEIVGSVLQFRYIDPVDRPIFLLSVTDCMAQNSTEYADVSPGRPEAQEAPDQAGQAQGRAHR